MITRSDLFLLYKIPPILLKKFSTLLYSNSFSLLNIQSIQDFQKKIGKKIEEPRFRGNISID